MGQAGVAAVVSERRLEYGCRGPCVRTSVMSDNRAAELIEDTPHVRTHHGCYINDSDEDLPLSFLLAPAERATRTTPSL